MEFSADHLDRHSDQPWVRDLTTADAIAGLAPLLRARPELQNLCRFGQQWTSPHEPEGVGWAPFHIVTKGFCLIDTPQAEGVRLKAGDVAVLPHGGPHAVHDATGMIGAPRPVEVRRLKSGVMLRAMEPSDTELVCGRFRFEHAQDNMVLAALPPIMVVSADAARDALRFRTLIGAIRDEIEDDRIGAGVVACDLASALIVIVLRSHFDGRKTNRGVLALMANRQTGRALNAMLLDPARPWSLDDLSLEAHTSRATLVRMFRRQAGMAPLAFLAELRLNLARRRLEATRDPIALVAETVGYQSESAFSRAYLRRFGTPPGAGRRLSAPISPRRSSDSLAVDPQGDTFDPD